MPTRTRWNNIEVQRLVAITSILNFLFQAMKVFSIGFKHLHMPKPGKCFHSHPETFCYIAEKIVENEQLWAALPTRLFVKAEIAEAAHLPKDHNYYVDNEIPKVQIRAKLKKLVLSCH